MRARSAVSVGGPRLSELDGRASRLSSVFSLEDARLLQNEFGGAESLAALLDRPEFARFYSAVTFNRREFLHTLAAFSASGSAYLRTRSGESAMPPAVLDTSSLESSQELDQKKAPDPRLKLFVHYCARCHQGAEKTRFNFMNAETEEQLVFNLRANPEVLRRLSWETLAAERRMPPPSARQAAELERPDNSDRALMLELLTETKVQMKDCDLRLHERPLKQGL